MRSSLIAAIALLLASVVFGDVSVREIVVPESHSSLVVGPDRNIWEVDDAAHVLRQLTGGAATLPIPFDHQGDIVADNAGQFWIPLSSGIRTTDLTGRITVINYSSQATSASRLAPDGVGGAWFVALNSIGSLMHVNANGAEQRYDVGYVGSIVANPDSSATVISDYPRLVLSRVTIAGSISSATIPSAMFAPRMVRAADGTLWLGSNYETYLLHVSDSGTFLGTVDDASSISSYYSQANIHFVAAADGSVWFGRPNSLVRIAPDGRVARYQLAPPPFCGPTTYYAISPIGFDPNGKLWAERLVEIPQAMILLPPGMRSDPCRDDAELSAARAIGFAHLIIDPTTLLETGRRRTAR